MLAELGQAEFPRQLGGHCDLEPRGRPPLRPLIELAARIAAEVVLRLMAPCSRFLWVQKP